MLRVWRQACGMQTSVYAKPVFAQGRLIQNNLQGSQKRVQFLQALRDFRDPRAARTFPLFKNAPQGKEECVAITNLRFREEISVRDRIFLAGKHLFFLLGFENTTVEAIYREADTNERIQPILREQGSTAASYF